MAKKWGLFLSILLVSCGSIRKDAHIAVYKRDWIGEIPPEYLILRFDDQIYDTYHGAGGQIGEVGKFTIKDDTLFCAQSYSRLSDRTNTLNKDAVPWDRIFLIKSNCLLEITDYSFLDSLYGFHAKENSTYYKRIL